MEDLAKIVETCPNLTLAELADADTRLPPALEWNELKPLQRELPSPEQFPIDSLGSILAPAGRKMHEIIQSPAAICGQSVLAAAALAVQGQADIQIDGRSFPSSGFFITVGDSGERKSAVDTIALQAQRNHQKRLKEQFDGDLFNYKINSDAYKTAREEALKKNKGVEAKRAALESLGPAPEPPLEPVILAEEPTYEGLVKAFATGQPSIGMVSDEGGRMVGGHAMNADNQLKTAAGLSLLWDGKPITRVRAGDGCSVLYGRRLSVHLMVQPSVADLLLSNPELREQGLLSRCLVSFPESTAGTRRYREVNLADEQDIKTYSWRLSCILEAPLSLARGKANELEPRRLQLDAAAKRQWIAFHDEIEGLLKSGERLSAIRGFANKAPEHAARLSAILAVTDLPDTTIIDSDHLSAGVDLTRYYIGEALRLFDSAAQDAELLLAGRLLAWLLARRKPVISLVEIYRCGPNQVRNAKTASKLMEVLREHGWVRPSPEPVVFEDVKRTNAWEVRLQI
jgi:hypothetical protein